jgi:hypothetical protein
MTNGGRTMSETTKTNALSNNSSSAEAGRVILVGVLGGLASAAGYLVYMRLPDEQKDRLNRQVRGLIETRINEIRANFNI